MIAKPQMWWPGLNRQHPLAPDVACWPLWESPGSQASELIGSYVAVLQADAHWSGSRLGCAIELDGTGDYLDVADNPYMITGVQKTGISFGAVIIVPAVATGVGTVGVMGGAGAWTHTAYTAGGINLNHGALYTVPEFVIYDGAYKVAQGSTAEALQAGEMVALVGSLTSNGDMTIYLRGIAVGTNTATMGGLSIEPDVFGLGRMKTGYFTGQIVLGCIWRRGLLVPEVRVWSAAPFASLRGVCIARRYVPALGGVALGTHNLLGVGR